MLRTLLPHSRVEDIVGRTGMPVRRAGKGMQSMKYDAAAAGKLNVAIEDPLVVDDPDAFAWDETADLVVVGFGGAGVAAALEGIERGLSIVAVDRYEGGGSTAANGGIFYAGGG